MSAAATAAATEAGAAALEAAEAATTAVSAISISNKSKEIKVTDIPRKDEINTQTYMDWREHVVDVAVDALVQMYENDENFDEIMEKWENLFKVGSQSNDFPETQKAKTFLSNLHASCRA